MRFEKLDLNLLVALDALIEDRNVSAASKRLHLSQPALSGALNRLRDFFGDELLAQNGRTMVLTPKAEELRGPVREALMFIRARITTPAAFEPATAERKFRIHVSDYAYDVLIADVTRKAMTLAPGVSFELFTPDRRMMERLERGEVDMIMTIDSYLPDTHPKQALYTDEHSVISWSEGRYAHALSAEEYLAAGHVIAAFGPDRLPAFTEAHLDHQGISRRVDISVQSFTSIPRSIVGTDRLATMYRRHAEYFAQFMPITIQRPPLSFPDIVELAQWHTSRAGDGAIRWLLDLCLEAEREMHGGQGERKCL